MTRSRVRGAALVAAALLVVAGCGGGGGGGGGGTQAEPAPAGPPQRGGELIVLEGTFAGGYPSGLDPATNTTGGANISMNNAIFGGLFMLVADEDGSNARIEPNQAESYELLDGGTRVIIKIRPGITFSDGTPFDAEAVAFNFNRNYTSECSCRPLWPLAENGITVVDPLTVQLQFTRPTASVINAFPSSNVNWIVSPTALQQQGPEQFKITPVGAGPFKVVSNQLSSQLVLERNPTYHKEGLPYLDRLTFQTIGGDQPAYQALLAGQAQAYEGLSTTPLLEQAQQQDRLSVTVQPATSPYVIQLNTKAAPFNDQRAREAIYAATDFNAIAQGLFRGLYPVSQSFTGPGGLFYQETVDGYPPYDPERARQLVNELGGLTVKLGTLKAYVAEQVNTALQTQWQEAGINVTIESYELSQLVAEFNSGAWQSMLQTAGAWDPAAGVGVAFRFRSDSPFTGVADPALDQLLDSAAATVDVAERERLYIEAGKYISDNAYAPFGLAFASANLATEGVHGPGLTTKIPPLVVNAGVIWDSVWRTQT